MFTGQFDVISGVTYEKSVKSCFQLLNFYETSQNSTSKWNTKNWKRGFIGKPLATHWTLSGSQKWMNIGKLAFLAIILLCNAKKSQKQWVPILSDEIWQYHLLLDAKWVREGGSPWKSRWCHLRYWSHVLTVDCMSPPPLPGRIFFYLE